MAHRHPITRHPAFAPLIALWLAALLGLLVAVLPAALVERALAAVGLGTLVPLTVAGRVAASVVAAVIGVLAGYALVRQIVRRSGGDPRPVYSEAGPAYEDMVEDTPARRPLHVREELADGFGDESQVWPGEPQPAAPPTTITPDPVMAKEPEGFMILTPQPIHPPRPAPDLEALLDQFDSAFVAFNEGEDKRGATGGERPGADPVRAFVAQQTGSPAPPPAASPLGGLVPDHQAELRAALDKLARSQRTR